MFIFGKTTEEIHGAREAMKHQNYEQYFCDELKEIIADIRGGILGDPNIFNDLIDSFTQNNDFYLVGTDFLDYKHA